MLHLYGYPDSVLQLMLLMKEVEYKVEDTPPDGFTPPSLTEPTIRFHETWVYGRNACVLYLDAVFPYPELLPAEPSERARTWMLYEWILNMPEEELRQVLPDFYDTILRRGGMLFGREPRLCDVALVHRLLDMTTGAGWENYIRRVIPHAESSGTVPNDCSA